MSNCYTSKSKQLVFDNENNPAPNALLYDDFANASNITNNWVLSGSPKPVWVSSAFGKSGLFDNNGDSWYTSSGYSKMLVGSTNGFTIE